MIRLRCVVGVLLALGCCVRAAHAQPEDGKRIIAVDVRGVKVVAAETVLAKVQTKPGGPYDSEAVSEDIRRIFAMGYFTTVEADLTQLPDGLRLTFVVKEKPSITAVDIEGNRFLSRPKALELFAVSIGELYDPRKVKEGIDLVKAEYVRKGFSQCEVVSHLQEDPAANTVALSLLVDEGPKMRIAGVLMKGNTGFSDRRIRKLLKTKRRKWLVRGVYDEQVVTEDLERVRAFYRKHGYQDINVSHTVYRDPSGRGLYVHFTVAEGQQYRVGTLAVSGAVLFPEPQLRRLTTLKPGAVYNSEAMQEDLRTIKQYYGDRGYINAEVTPDPQLDPETKRVNLTYQITEQELVYVNRIAVRGNLYTKDAIARRELRIYPGERFDGSKIRKSIDRLYNLGFFEEVNVETEPTQTPNKEDLVVQVKEAKTGSFSFGGGFSSVDRVVGLVELEQRNFDWRNVPKFTGAGQDLRLRMEVGTVRRYFDLSFTEPWIFNQPLSFGFDIFSRTRLRSRSLGLGFEEKRRGGGVRFGKEFTDLVRVSLGYQFFRTDISDVVAEASADLKAEQGRSDVSIANLSVARDARDNRFEPTQGSHLFASTDLAGGVLAGNRDFYRLQGGASHYLSHAKRFVLESSLRAGVVKAYGDSGEVPIFERFFGGGTGTIRGFRERHVGPRDPSSNDPIGGESLFVGTLEEVMTIVKDERGRPILKGSVFYDIGDVWRRADEFAESFKSGTGVGMRVTTPIGPVRLDIGFPISQIEGEKREVRFHFNVSRGF